MPVLATLEEEFASQNLAVVTVCLGSSAARVREALQKANVDLVTLVDGNSETTMPFRIRGTPTTYLVSADGVVLLSDVGYGRGKEEYLRGEIRRLLSQE